MSIVEERKVHFYSNYRALYQSALPKHLKATAGAMLVVGNADGTSIYPSVAYVAWLTSISTKSARTDISALVKLGVLKPVSSRKGGRCKSTHYRFIVSALPSRPSWRQNTEVDGHVNHANPEVDCRVSDQKPGSRQTKPGSEQAKNPVVDFRQPSSDQPEDQPGTPAAPVLADARRNEHIAPIEVYEAIAHKSFAQSIEKDGTVNESNVSEHFKMLCATDKRHHPNPLKYDCEEARKGFREAQHQRERAAMARVLENRR